MGQGSIKEYIIDVEGYLTHHCSLFLFLMSPVQKRLHSRPLEGPLYKNAPWLCLGTWHLTCSLTDKGGSLCLDSVQYSP